MDSNAPIAGPVNPVTAPAPMIFGSDTVTKTGLGSSNANYTVTPSSVQTSGMAKDDLGNIKNDLGNINTGIQNQTLNNQQNQQNQNQQSSDKSATDAAVATDKAKTDALNKASGALNGTNSFGTNSSETNSSVNDYAANQKAIQDNTQAAYNQINNSIANINNGTTPLTTDQQNQVNALQTQFNHLRDQQQQANDMFTGGTTTNTVRSGTSRYAGEYAAAAIKNSVDQGVAKIAEIDAKAASAVSNLTQGFKDGNIKSIRDSYTAYNDLQKEKSGMLDKLNTYATAQLKLINDEKTAALTEQKTNLNFARTNGLHPDAQFWASGGKIYDGSGKELSAQDALTMGVKSNLSNVQMIETTKTRPGALGEMDSFNSALKEEGKPPINIEQYNQMKKQDAMDIAVAGRAPKAATQAENDQSAWSGFTTQNLGGGGVNPALEGVTLTELLQYAKPSNKGVKGPNGDVLIGADGNFDPAVAKAMRDQIAVTNPKNLPKFDSTIAPHLSNSARGIVGIGKYSPYLGQ
jgi:hypothetical protein